MGLRLVPMKSEMGCHPSRHESENLPGRQTLLSGMNRIMNAAATQVPPHFLFWPAHSMDWLT